MARFKVTGYVDLDSDGSTSDSDLMRELVGRLEEQGLQKVFLEDESGKRTFFVTEMHSILQHSRNIPTLSDDVRDKLRKNNVMARGIHWSNDFEPHLNLPSSRGGEPHTEG